MTDMSKIIHEAFGGDLAESSEMIILQSPEKPSVAEPMRGSMMPHGVQYIPGLLHHVDRAAFD